MMMVRYSCSVGYTGQDAKFLKSSPFKSPLMILGDLKWYVESVVNTSKYGLSIVMAFWSGNYTSSGKRDKRSTMVKQ